MKLNLKTIAILIATAFGSNVSAQTSTQKLMPDQAKEDQ